MSTEVNAVTREQQMDYLRRYRGLIGIRSKVPVKDSAMLSLLYTPGVAEVCRAIVEDPLSSYTYTCRGNTVALVSNGSGLFGIKGAPPEAALPALEGKSIIFKTFAGIDALPIVLDAEHTTEMVETVAALGPTFGAICLEDIAAPRSLQVAALLERAMTIPVVSNHQHIVAIGTLAALMNACKVAGKELKDLKIVINGSGNAAVGLVDLLEMVGARNTIVCDRHGVLTPFRLHDMNWSKRYLAKRTNPERREGTLAEVLCGADAFVGYSAGGVLTPDMVRSMAPDPIVFAFALPEPEILPPLAEEAGAAVVATGRSDFANGINIALVFPGFFRGLLDVQALDVNDQMLLGAARCLADQVPDPTRYQILPDVLDFRVAPALAEAVARIALETGQARNVNADPAAIAEWTCRYVYEGQAAIVAPPCVGPDASLRDRALDLRRRYRGALEIQPNLPIRDHYTLSMYLSPADAQPAEAIAQKPELVDEITAKGNLVAIVTDGSAVLGLGNIGPRAGLPVMEGKAILFHTFAGVQAFPICVATQTSDEIIEIVQRLAPTFGGVNLEDIAAPRCFEIENKLKATLDIPVFHDDQHGTAIISGAALINGLEIVGKPIGEVKITISGAGASAISCAELMVRLGATRENIYLVDTRGVVFKGRTEGMNKYKERFALETDARTLADAVRGSDVFYGLSIADVLTPEMVKTMAQSPLIFAMANPDPEIKYELAKEARPDAIVATGRSDYPNQINNVLGFPFIFRGALDVRARAINEEMKVAASQALAKLTKEDVPDSVLRAYGLDSLRFGPEYIIPKPLDPRVLLWESPAVAGAAMETGAARRNIDLDEYREQLAFRQGMGEQVRYYIMHKAQSCPVKKRLVFAEGEENKIIRAAARILDDGIGTPILVGRKDVIQEKLKALGLDFCPEVIDPSGFERIDEYIQVYYELRNRKGITLKDAAKRVREPNVFGPMMVKMGDADAFISGLTSDYPDVIRPALQIHHTAAGVSKAAGVYIMIVSGKVYLFTDATVNIEPTAEDLAEIACLAADFARQLGLEPRVALLSFSNFGSTPHPLSEKVQKAVQIIRSRCLDFEVDGEMQADTAIVPDIIDKRYPFSAVKDANVLVFPSLEAANVAYKLLARLGNAQAIGPILLGVGAPIHVLQTGDEVRDIVNIAAVAVMDSMKRDGPC